MYKRLSVFLDNVTIEVQNKGGNLIAKERNIKMTEERRKQIEDFANKTGLSFVDAKRMLEEIEEDDFSYGQTMAEIAY